MKAAYYQSPGPAREVLRVGEVETPTPGLGEVLVRIAASGVNPSDVKMRAGLSTGPVRYPRVVPHSDGAGIIEAVGADVPAMRVGERVWLYNGQWERPFGTAAECIALPSAQAVPLPAEVGFDAGASLGIPAMTAFHAVERCGPLVGRTVVVTGAAGSVGLYATQLASIGGARVVAVVSSDAKAALATQAGAAQTVDYRTLGIEGAAAHIRDATGGRGADAVIDVDASTWAPHYSVMLAFGGKAVIYGSNRPEIAMPFGPAIRGFVAVEFFIVYRLPSDAMARTTAAITRLLADGRLRSPAIERYSLERVAQAHEAVERGTSAKVIVAP
jgi:NADPH2:quinone reductase